MSANKKSQRKSSGKNTWIWGVVISVVVIGIIIGGYFMFFHKKEEKKPQYDKDGNLIKGLEESKVQAQIKKMNANPKMVDLIKEKAKSAGLSYNEQVRNDAMWLLKAA